MKCSRCGEEIPDNSKYCINCGTQINNMGNKDNRRKKIIVIASLIILIIMVSILLITQSIKGERIKKATNALSSMYELTLNEDIQAYSTCVMIHTIWYDSIYKEFDNDTYMYTMDSNGNYHDDFNVSLSLYFSSVDYENAVKHIKDTENDMKILLQEMDDEPNYVNKYYKAAEKIYKTYSKLADIAVSPSGNINTFSTNYSSLNDDYTSATKDAIIILGY